MSGSSALSSALWRFRPRDILSRSRRFASTSRAPQPSSPTPPPSFPPNPNTMQYSEDDIRPPWMYRGVFVSMLMLPPVALTYGVFFYDFGDFEHVFSPVRRWARRKAAAFFSLSQEEKEILDQQATLKEEGS